MPHTPKPANASVTVTIANDPAVRGSTTRRRLKLKCRCSSASGTLTSEWMSSVPAVAAQTRPTISSSKNMVISGAAARVRPDMTTPVPRLAQNAVSVAFSTSVSRWISAARMPPSAMVTAKLANSVPAVKTPISSTVSRRATKIVWISEISWVKISATAANCAPRRRRLPRFFSEGLCSSGASSWGEAPPSKGGSTGASGMACPTPCSARSARSWGRDEPGEPCG